MSREGERRSPSGALRPQSLGDFIGQKRLCRNLKVFIDAAAQRGDPLEHVLLHGPPGLGKTTLARIIAHESGAALHATAGPAIARTGEVAALLTNLERGDVLFIDEVHRLQPAVEELLYGAMEDFHLDLIIGQGVAARSVRLPLKPFTLVAATTRSGLLSRPLRERFGIPLRLDFYHVEDLEKVVARYATLLEVELTAAAAYEIARRARMTPRTALRLVRRVRDFSGEGRIEAEDVRHSLDKLEVDGLGLDALDRRYLSLIALTHGGGPVGVETLAAALCEQRDVIEDSVEPFLLQAGMVRRTPRGRVMAAGGWTHLGLKPPAGRREAAVAEKSARQPPLALRRLKEKSP